MRLTLVIFAVLLLFTSQAYASCAECCETGNCKHAFNDVDRGMCCKGVGANSSSDCCPARSYCTGDEASPCAALPKYMTALSTDDCTSCCNNGTCEAAFNGGPGQCCAFLDGKGYCCPSAPVRKDREGHHGKHGKTKCKLSKHTHEIICKTKHHKHPSFDFDDLDFDNSMDAAMVGAIGVLAVFIGILVLVGLVRFCKRRRQAARELAASRVAAVNSAAPAFVYQPAPNLNSTQSTGYAPLPMYAYTTDAQGQAQQSRAPAAHSDYVPLLS